MFRPWLRAYDRMRSGVSRRASMCTPSVSDQTLPPPARSVSLSGRPSDLGGAISLRPFARGRRPPFARPPGAACAPKRLSKIAGQSSLTNVNPFVRWQVPRNLRAAEPAQRRDVAQRDDVPLALDAEIRKPCQGPRQAFRGNADAPGNDRLAIGQAHDSGLDRRRRRETAGTRRAAAPATAPSAAGSRPTGGAASGRAKTACRWRRRCWRAAFPGWGRRQWRRPGHPPSLRRCTGYHARLKIAASAKEWPAPTTSMIALSPSLFSANSRTEPFRVT